MDSTIDLAGRAPPRPRGFDLSRRWALRLAATWWITTGILLAAAGVFVAATGGGGIADYFLLSQDLGLVLSSCIVFVAILLPSARLSPRAAGAVRTFVERRGEMACLGIGLGAAALAFAGWTGIYHAYPLSMDEFWARFDMQLFERGRLLTPVAPEWRPFAQALQPLWRLHTPGDAFWSSTYLPVSAAFRALGARLGSEALVGAAWTVLSLGLIYDLARKLWPERRDAAFVAVLLLASSSQFLVAAMSPYAMSAHLALNLAWLWLFLRPGWGFHLAALIVAFAATGLHQLIFHPLFAAPFILQLWLQRRWRLAAVYTVAYAAICLFWVSYWSLLLKSHGLEPAAAGEMAASGFAPKVLGLIKQFGPGALGLMAENLTRFAAWQNPIAVCLALLAVPAVVRAWRTPLAPMLGGMVLTVLIIGVVLPSQGHGWGYRYLHGFLGSLCLLAAFGWVRLTEGVDGEVEGRAWGTLGLVTALAVLVGVPLRLSQVSRMIEPYADASRAIEHAPAEVVLVDQAGLWFGPDLVRNDPFLSGPKVMSVDDLRPAQVAGLCARYRVARFDVSDGKRFGIRTVPVETAPTQGALALRSRIECAPHVAAMVR